MKHLQAIRMAKEKDDAIPMEPMRKIIADVIRPIFRPNLSATRPAINEPMIDAKVIDEVSISTCLRNRYFR